MDKFDWNKLESGYVDIICKFIEDKQNEISKFCVNELIRDDIFSLLDQFCTVIYYPTNDSKNNGFHVNYKHNNGDIHFVYINTQQHKEKQIFTAAHELGHIWNIIDIFDIESNIELEEKIINRFASELLMPKEHFDNFVKKEIGIYLVDNAISRADMIKVITATMNHFFTSYKSVIYRIYENDILDSADCGMLWGETLEHPREQLIELSQKFAKEKGYTRLYQADGRKWINGLKELLDSVNENDTMSPEWLQAFYERFDFKIGENETNLEQTLSILNWKEGL